MRKFLIPLAFAIAALAAGQIDPGKTVVTINGEEIKGAEYYRRMEFLGGVGKVFSSGFVEFPPGFMTIEQLITERLVMQFAKDKGVMPTDAEVQAELNLAKAQDPDLLKKWQEAGRTEAELLYQTKLNLAQFKLVTRGITVTDSEVERFYSENPTLFTAPKQLDLYVIVVSDEPGQRQVEADLASGKSFSEVAKERSIDTVTKPTGGHLGIQSWDSLSDAAREKLNGVVAGKSSDWIVGGQSRAKFFVAKIIPPSKKPLDAALKASIRREQMLAKGRVANNIQKEMSDYRRKASVDIKEKSFADAYRKFMSTFLTGG